MSTRPKKKKKRLRNSCEEKALSLSLSNWLLFIFHCILWLSFVFVYYRHCCICRNIPKQTYSSHVYRRIIKSPTKGLIKKKKDKRTCVDAKIKAKKKINVKGEEEEEKKFNLKQSILKVVVGYAGIVRVGVGGSEISTVSSEKSQTLVSHW